MHDLTFLQDEFLNIQRELKPLSVRYDKSLNIYKETLSQLKGSTKPSDKQKIEKAKQQFDLDQSSLEIALKNIAVRKLPYLRNKIIHHFNLFNLTEDQAWEILRRSHIHFLGKLFPKEGIKKTYRISSTSSANVTPEQKFECESQQKSLQTHFINCYSRWRAGMPALRQHIFSINGQEKISYFHHSSPVPNQIEDFETRILATESNFNELIKKIGEPITEIRLLSPVQEEHRIFNEMRKVDSKQIIETAFAVLRCSNSINMFVYGVNIFRNGHGVVRAGFQTQLNTLAMNQLFEKCFKNLDVIFSNYIHAKTIANLQTTRNQFRQRVKNISLSNGKEQVIREFKRLLKEQHQQELALNQIYMDIWNDVKIQITSEKKKINLSQVLLFNDLRLLCKLRENKNFNVPKYNGQIQAVLVRLNKRLGENVCTGCEDAKDRDGLVSIAVESNEIFYAQHGRYPYAVDANDAGKDDVDDREKIKKIQRSVYEKSTPAIVSEMVSWLYAAKNIDIGSSNQIFSGFKHLNNIGTAGGIFKKIYEKTPKPLNKDESFIQNYLIYLLNLNHEERKKALDKINDDLVFSDVSIGIIQYYENRFRERYALFENYEEKLILDIIDAEDKESASGETKQILDFIDRKKQFVASSSEEDKPERDITQELESFPPYVQQTIKKIEAVRLIKDEYQRKTGKERNVIHYIEQAEKLNRLYRAFDDISQNKNVKASHSNLDNNNHQNFLEALKTIQEDRSALGVFGRIFKIIANCLFILALPFTLKSSYNNTKSCRFWDVKGKRLVNSAREEMQRLNFKKG